MICYWISSMGSIFQFRVIKTKTLKYYMLKKKKKKDSPSQRVQMNPLNTMGCRHYLWQWTNKHKKSKKREIHGGFGLHWRTEAWSQVDDHELTTRRLAAQECNEDICFVLILFLMLIFGDLECGEFWFFFIFLFIAFRWPRGWGMGHLMSILFLGFIFLPI